MRKRVIIDCDPGYDDALALILAFGSKEIDIKAVTACAGNQTVDKTFQNLVNITRFLGVDVEIGMGAKKPLRKELLIASEVHGETGLDGTGIKTIRYDGEPANAIDLMRKVIKESESKITLIVTGPLTNASLLLSTYPEVKSNIQEIVFMGGACYGGNVTPVTEYNMRTDPDAAQIVLNSGVNIVMAGLDVTHKALFNDEDLEEISKIGNSASVLTNEIFEAYSKFYKENTELDGVPVHDACAVAYVIDPELFEYKECFVDIEICGKYSSGQTIVDIRDLLKRKKNCKVLFDINKKMFLDRLKRSINNLG